MDGTRPPGRTSGPRPRSGARRETVLVVEDEESVRAAVRRLLQRQHYTVLEARNGREALAVRESHGGPVDLVLSDVVMPVMGGRELAERLRAIDPELRVLLMSGYNEEAIRSNGALIPGAAFLSKPFSMETLLRTVRELLDGTERRER